MTFEQIKELLEIVAQRRLAGLEVERAGFRLRIEGWRAEAAAPAGGAEAVRSAAPAEPAPAPQAEREAEPAQGEAPSVPEDAQVVTSPIVGTFYRAPAPDAEPYVEVGSRVSKGQVLCIVEAMKLMNEIESDADGTIIEVFPKNAQPVEFGEPLFALRPA